MHDLLMFIERHPWGCLAALAMVCSAFGRGWR